MQTQGMQLDSPLHKQKTGLNQPFKMFNYIIKGCPMKQTYCSRFHVQTGTARFLLKKLQ